MYSYFMKCPVHKTDMKVKDSEKVTVNTNGVKKKEPLLGNVKDIICTIQTFFQHKRRERKQPIMKNLFISAV